MKNDIISEREAIEYIKHSPPDTPIYQKSLLALERIDNRKTRRIAWLALLVSAIALLVSILRHF